MDELIEAISAAFEYCKTNRIDMPVSLYIKARNIGAIKADGDWSSIIGTYHDAITEALIEYFESDSTVTALQNVFKRAVLTAFNDVFDLGWTDGGSELPLDEDAVTWIENRINTEFGFVIELFQQAKQLRGEKDFDYFSWASEKADGYSQTLNIIYNNAVVMSGKNIMLTFDGDDGAESCTDCQKYKDKRHKASWWISHNAVPPNRDFICHGYNCQHILVDDNGEVWAG